MTHSPLAPDLDVSGWISGAPTTLADLRGQVVVLEAFQMLCPGCVRDGLPLAQRVRRAFSPDEVAVIGLHTVFEHHDVMGPDALTAFVSEYRWEFPIAIDRHAGDDPIPATVQAYGLQGTPSTVLIDRDGRIRLSAFGAVDELQLGAALGRLLAEPVDPPTAPDAPSGVCAPGRDCT